MAKKSVRPPEGTYSANAGGYVSEFSVGDRKYRIKCENGIRTPSAPDTVTVTKDEIRSSRLGKATEIEVYEKL